MDLIYRPATAEDIPTLATFAAQSFTEKFGYLYSRENLENHLQEAYSEAYHHSQLNKVKFLVVLDGDKLIGYAKWGPLGVPVDNPITPNGEIHRLYVDGHYQGQKIGHKLMQHMMDDMADKEAIYLGVWSENEGAIRFYERYGFKKCGEYKYMVGTHADDEFIMVRKA